MFLELIRRQRSLGFGKRNIAALFRAVEQAEAAAATATDANVPPPTQ